MKNIILVTIDCWRYDDLSKMKDIKTLAKEYDSGSCISASPYTAGAFPAIFCSNLFPDVYSEKRQISNDVVSLPQLLSDYGYKTGGFVGSNGMLDSWSEHFDEYWNDGLYSNSVNDSEKMTKDSTLSDVIEHLRLRSEVNADIVFEKANGWWNKTSESKFLWVHLMEPHSPYLPGLRRGLKTGPIKTYLSLLLFAKHDDNLDYNNTFPTWAKNHLIKLHNECVRLLDEKLYHFLRPKLNNSKFIVTGDHGEEFYHGLINTHASLYDETVRVPFITNTNVLPKSKFIRQIDIAPSLLNIDGIPVPSNWKGESTIEYMPPQSMIGSLNKYDRPVWFGVRSEQWKIIRKYLNGSSSTKMFNLDQDPNEEKVLSCSEAPAYLMEELEFIEKKYDLDYIRKGFVGKPESTTKERLRKLGYLE